jgi:hypothetical protein
VLELLWAPFLACLVLTAIHVYLGLHVLARGVIFVDLARPGGGIGITVAFWRAPDQSEAPAGTRFPSSARRFLRGDHAAAPVGGDRRDRLLRLSGGGC